MDFAPFLARWDLTPDGPPIHSGCGDLLPVRFRGRPAMLKVARIDEERRGHRLMVWWGGEGAARVYAHRGPALLMERLDDDVSLKALALRGPDHDDEATRLLCRAARVLHRPRPQPWPKLPTLAGWFRALERRASQGGLYAQTWQVAQRLLAAPQDVCPLHGDLHHANLLHSPGRGWLAIDPKGLIGERTFDFANLMCNPTPELARAPGRLARQAAVIAQAAGVERSRLLAWVAAYAGLSAAWHLADQEPAAAGQTLDLARLALAELAPD